MPLKLTLLLGAAAIVALAGAGHAQRYGHAPAAGSDPTGFSQSPNDSNAIRLQEGREAIGSKNFRGAVFALSDVLRHNPTHPEANLLMGVARMSQDEWAEARKHLEVAVKKSPKEPDPKSRLAVTLIKLGDIPAAMKQRDDLVRLGEACKSRCRNAEWIAAGLAMIDATLPPAPAP
ncbi:MAG: tetratricopeptide repeat protein [Alphaproteobacteria bacterium]|nr:tetratricopeptide repeat protein [Alphaproteobacteria bacterium]